MVAFEMVELLKIGGGLIRLRLCMKVDDQKVPKVQNIQQNFL